MTRVPDWSEQEFEDRSDKLAGLIRRAWRAVARLISGQLESKPIVTAADAGGISTAWEMEAEAQVLGFLTDTYLDAAGKVRAAVDAPDDFLLTDDLVAAYLRTARNRLRHIGDEVWQEVSAQLIQGVSAGESIPELAMRVRNTAGVSDARSLTIARTEVHAAHEAGSYDQALFVDPDASKIWLATEDVRTRETHRAADGQRRKLNEPFEVGGGQLRYPGDPLGPADEVINCRCTTVYDFGTLDSVTSDDPELALVAASKKKWTPSKHPRGNDGKFIKKGAVSTLLSKPKPELITVADAIHELTEKSWGQLTDDQQDYIRDSYGKLPKGSYLEKVSTQKLTEIGALKAQPAAPEAVEAPAVPKAKVLAQAAPKTNKAAKTILETDDFAQLGNQKYKKPLGKTGKPLRVGFLGDDGSITAHVGSEPGDPAKVSTFLIWGKYPPGTTILESADGKDSVVWNGKKFDFRTDGQTTKTLGKQDTYDTLHSQTGWVVPKQEGQPVDQPGVLTELVEGYVAPEPDDEIDTDIDVPAVPAQVEPDVPATPVNIPETDGSVAEAVDEIAELPEQLAESEVIAPDPGPTSKDPFGPPPDVSGLKDTGITVGSHGARIYEDEGGQRWLFKRQDQFATDLDIGASKLQALAGRPYSDTFAVTMPNGKSGSIQKMLPGKSAFPKPYQFKATNLSEQEIGEVLSEHPLDWLIGNYDAHSENYIELPNGEGIGGVDKGNSLKFFGQDALDWDWRPNEHRTVYSELWRAFAGGKDVDITPANLEKMQAAVARLQQIPDDTIRELFRPYAEGVHAKGWLATAKSNSWAEKLKPRTVPPQNVEAFLDAIVARKNGLDQDFQEFHAKALDARVKALGVPVESLQPASVPDAVPQAPEVPVPDVPEVDEGDILQQLIDGVYQDAVSDSLTSLKTNGQISDVDAVQLVTGMTQDEWNGLTADQRSKLALGVDAALDNPNINNSNAWLAFNKISDFQSKQSAPVLPPSPAMQIPTPAAVEDDEDANELPHDSAWADLFDGNAYPPEPVVIAESSAGNYRVVAQTNNTFSLEVNDGGVWIDIETFDPNVSEESFSEIAESHASGWHAVTPVAVPAVFPTPPAPAPMGATPALTLPDTTWTLSAGKSKSEIEAYTSFNHPAGTILGITPDANMQVVSKADGTYVLQTAVADGWMDSASLMPGTVASMFEDNVWTLPDSTFDAAMPTTPSVPAWKLVPAIEPPEGTVYEPVGGYLGVLDNYVNFDHPAGTVIALRNVNGVNVRIVKTGLDDPEYKTQLQSLSDGQWYDNNAGDVSAALVINQLQTNEWLLPQSALLPALGPKTTPVGPSSPDVTPAPAASGADTSSIPTFYKKSWKKKLSAAKVGYYSAPTKIWDQVKEIQAQHPDPANPGQSKYTPLQIIKSLDDVYTGKKEQNPYEAKMVAWAATSKGKTYTGNTGTTQAATPNTPAATQTATPPDPKPMELTNSNLSQVFDAVQDLDLGTVLATTVDVKGQQFQIVVADAAGVKTPQMQYMATGETTFTPNIFMHEKAGFVSALNIDFGAGPWKLAVVQVPNGGVAPAPNLAPLPSPSGPVTTQLPVTSANIGQVWNKLPQLPEGTVVATNESPYNDYQAVVKFNSNGVPYVQTEVKSKSVPGASWSATDTIFGQATFGGVLKQGISGQSWKLFDPTLAPAGPNVSAPAGPPPPKPFKSTVKAIYAAMPTLSVGKPVAVAEFNGEKYALVPGYGFTKSYKKSTKKKLILKKQNASGAWATVEPLDTQAKLGAILKDPKYAWIEAAETLPVPPPSVSAPITPPKPSVSIGVFKNTPDDIANMWDSLNEIGNGVTLADGTPNGVPTKLMSKISQDGTLSVIAHTETGETVFATDQQSLVSKLNSDATWTITASKSPLFGAGDIANLSPAQQQSLYEDFKKQPATYLKSPAQDIYAALSSIASDNGLTLLQMLRVIDVIGAKKVNKPDEHLFEKKIKDWLKTPQGAAVASGKPMPVPVGPALSPSVSLSGMESFEESNKYTYKTISTTQATDLGSAFKKASPAGSWTSEQQAGLKAYTGGIYYSINQYYYGKIPTISSTNEKAAKDAQLGMRPSTVPMLLHRGTGFDGVGGASSHADLVKMTGQTFFSGGFFSTSVAGKAAFAGKSVILEIEAPPGTPMAYLKNISLHKGENEMLLAAGLSYRIQEVRKEGGKSVVRVRVVPAVGPYPWEMDQEG